MFDTKLNITSLVAQRIRQLRTAKNLSQEGLALSAQIATSYLGQLERGLKTPTIETVFKICNALDISLSEFFIFDGINDEDKYNLAYFSILSSLKDLPPDSAMRISLIIQELAHLNSKS